MAKKFIALFFRSFIPVHTIAKQTTYTCVTYTCVQLSLQTDMPCIDIDAYSMLGT